MICNCCRQAALELAAGDRDESLLLHASCRGGTWCDCQHWTEPRTKASLDRAVAAMNRQETAWPRS